MSARTCLLLSLALLVAPSSGVIPLQAQTPALSEAKGPPPPANRLPPAGITISEKDRAELTAGAAALRKSIDALARELAAAPDWQAALLPDIEIFHKAVDWALRYDEFFDPKQVEIARHLLAKGRERVTELRGGKAPWLEATGLIIRGYRSQLDDSVQPYALVVPAAFTRADRQPRRLDVVLAGRNEKRTELAFIAEHEKSPGEIVPANGIVLHPYGRFCNATKFAGESDVFEAIAAVRASYPVDADRIIVRGFSMGGASTWHLAVHHPSFWCAASPGAGFAETAAYTHAFAPGKEPPAWWEQKLWRWYDATGYASNLFNCPTIAYSGELDPQKQSAFLMAEVMGAQGLPLEWLIGPKTGHKYEPATKAKLAARLDTLARRGRDPFPREVHLTTFTLQYSSNAWVTITGLEHHWERADVVAKLEKPDQLVVRTSNVTSLVLFPDSSWQGTLRIDGQRLKITGENQLNGISLVRNGEQWQPGALIALRRKAPGLTGPIDDAFMDGFIFVRPTGKPLSEKLGAWTQSELAHATKMWRDIFRGDAPIKDDTAITREDVAAHNLILWGDPGSNEIIAQILDRLPVQWDAQQLVFRGKTYDATHHAPILIFPNPLNPHRYVVLNSGIDFRNDAYGTNALQTPKLPDFAIVDLDTPPGPKWPGKIVDAGFFDEMWK